MKEVKGNKVISFEKKKNRFKKKIKWRAKKRKETCNNGKKTILEKKWSLSSFSKLQTCIQININTKFKRK